MWRKLERSFVGFVTQSVIEAAFGAPEYGGNRDLAGWKMIHTEGDVLPLGCSYYDEKSGRYRERAPQTVGGGSTFSELKFPRVTPVDFELGSRLPAIPDTNFADWPISYRNVRRLWLPDQRQGIRSSRLAPHGAAHRQLPAPL